MVICHSSFFDHPPLHFSAVPSTSHPCPFICWGLELFWPHPHSHIDYHICGHNFPLAYWQNTSHHTTLLPFLEHLFIIFNPSPFSLHLVVWFFYFIRFVIFNFIFIIYYYHLYFLFEYLWCVFMLLFFFVFVFAFLGLPGPHMCHTLFWYFYYFFSLLLSLSSTLPWFTDEPSSVRRVTFWQVHHFGHHCPTEAPFTKWHTHPGISLFDKSSHINIPHQQFRGDTMDTALGASDREGGTSPSCLININRGKICERWFSPGMPEKLDWCSISPAEALYVLVSAFKSLFHCLIEE